MLVVREGEQQRWVTMSEAIERVDSNEEQGRQV